MPNIESIFNTLCTGCTACKSVCPTGAITVKRNPSGYYTPIVDKEKCCNCETCDLVCPVFSQYPRCYAVWADRETRLASSSGGAFSVIAKHVLDQGGVVFGAAWTSDIFVQHTYIETYDDIDLLRRSKYAQSDIGDSFTQVKNFLNIGRKVLFVGTPCQVAGLKRFLENKGTNCDGLICADFICYCTPTIYHLRKYLNDKFEINNVEKVEFRLKDRGWICNIMRVRFKDGTERILSGSENAYFNAYFNGYLNREACKKCSFSKFPHISDFTLGDFWKIEQHDPSWNDNIGTSMLMVNNVKSDRIFRSLQKKFERCERFSVSDIRGGQKNCEYEPRNKKYFSYLLGIKRFDEAVDMAMNNIFDVGMVCVLNYKNFGSAITNYALYSAITKLKRSVYIITQPADSQTQPGGKQNFEVFKYPEYAIAPTYANVEAMKELNKYCKQFLVGSDQLFNYEIYKKISGFVKLNWVDDIHAKSVYAASFGFDKIFGNLEEKNDLKQNIARFRHFSTREETMVDMIKREFGINAKFVLDPVFLLENEHYERLVSEIKLTEDIGIFAYILDPLQETADIINQIASLINMPITAVTDMWRTKNDIQSLWSIQTQVGYSNERWIKSIMNSKFVITDSFHAMCFAIKFNKPFLVIPNKLRGEARAKSIMSSLGISNRIYSKEMMLEKGVLLDGIDFGECNKTLEILVRESINYLKMILGV